MRIAIVSICVCERKEGVLIVGEHGVSLAHVSTSVCLRERNGGGMSHSCIDAFSCMQERPNKLTSQEDSSRNILESSLVENKKSTPRLGTPASTGSRRRDV